MNSPDIAETIQRALTAAGLHPSHRPGGVDVHGVIADALSAAGLAPGASAGAWFRRPQAQEDAAVPASGRDAPGRFIWQQHSSPRGSRRYRLYVPAAAETGRRLPCLMMLHGCKQDPDDFAIGTRMNALAERHGFYVVYPEQTRRANGSNCWNWFEPTQQHPQGEEPGVLAAIISDVAATHAVDLDKVYVAGLSAGAAMAVILGQTHPEVFAAVGAHSGLPKGAAHDIPSAFAAMQSRSTSRAHATPGRAVRTMVIHGDADPTVNILNGATIAGQAVAAHEQSGARLQRLPATTFERGGRRCTVAVVCDPLGHPLVEEWVIHGGGHAWTGGDPSGSFVDRSGPDASAELVRFFLGADAAIAIPQAS
ncbi:MAG: alpha/beta hydrolase family esterase [Rhizobacter sp.]